MAILANPNPFSAQASSSTAIDTSRKDLFYVSLELPQALSQVSDYNWDTDIAFAVEKWPMPSRKIETKNIKYLQYQNKVLGESISLGDLSTTIRYAFNQDTIPALEAWFRLISNPITGGVAITSQVKTRGTVYMLVPNMKAQAANAVTGTNISIADVYLLGPRYELQGVLLVDIKPAELDMASADPTTYEVTFSIDNMYPDQPDWMNFNNLPSNLTKILSGPYSSLSSIL